MKLDKFELVLTCETCGERLSHKLHGVVVADPKSSDVEWQVFCDSHLPSWGYDIDTERMHTWHQVAEWTAHLSEKNWFKPFGWGELLSRMGCYGNG
jgi:hypothetical protein